MVQPGGAKIIVTKATVQPIGRYAVRGSKSVVATLAEELITIATTVDVVWPAPSANHIAAALTVQIICVSGGPALRAVDVIGPGERFYRADDTVVSDN